MDMLKAMEETLSFALQRGYDNISFDEVGVDFDHLASMYQRASNEKFSDAKLGRWLGYIQGVLVANQCGNLEEFKALNRKYADDWTHLHLKRGTRYKVVGQARAQCSTMPIQDGDMLTLYVGEDGVYSVRHPAEFGDGRFQELQMDLWNGQAESSKME